LVWPYRLDHGRPEYRPTVGPHPGLWEVPICDFIAPPAAQRRAVLIDFLDYALQNPEVRVVNIRELLIWLSRPSAFALGG
jgi:hypothetical protein